MKIFLIAILTALIFSPSLVISNGGQTQNIDGIIVGFSLVPVTPNSNEKVTFVLTFINTSNSTAYRFVNQNISLKIIVNSIQGERILETPNLTVEGGLILYNWTGGFPKD